MKIIKIISSCIVAIGLLLTICAALYANYVGTFMRPMFESCKLAAENILDVNDEYIRQEFDIIEFDLFAIYIFDSIDDKIWVQYMRKKNDRYTCSGYSNIVSGEFLSHLFWNEVGIEQNKCKNIVLSYRISGNFSDDKSWTKKEYQIIQNDKNIKLFFEYKVE